MNAESSTKITFLGDITCDRMLRVASRKKRGEYDFSPVFSQVGYILDESDYVIGNFETVCAGDKNDYKDQFMLCNTPDQLIEEISKTGIHCVTTANNHCLDQGIKGLKRTLEVLDKNGVEHIGTYANLEERKKIFYKNFRDLKVAFLAYTYDVNSTNIDIRIDAKNDYCVGLLKSQDVIANCNSKAKKICLLLTTGRQRRFVRRILARRGLKKGKAFMPILTDYIRKDDTNNPYLDKIKMEIEEARKNADYVFVCPHYGGQFNEEPGEYAAFLMKYLKECGADVVIGNHPHIVQKAIKTKGFVGAYSIGSFNQSVSADYMVHEPLPEYSVAVHFYFNDNKNVDKVTYSILKIVEDENKMITVWPVDKLYKIISDEEKESLRKDVLRISNRFTNSNSDKIIMCKEYELLGE